MPRYWIEFTKTCEFSVVAKSREELEEAAEDATTDIDFFFEPSDWEYTIREIPDRGDNPECGVADGVIYGYSDYLEEKEDTDEEEVVDPRQTDLEFESNEMENRKKPTSLDNIQALVEITDAALQKICDEVEGKIKKEKE